MVCVNLVRYVAHVQTVVIYHAGARILLQFLAIKLVIQIMRYLEDSVVGPMLRPLSIHVRLEKH